MNFFLVNEEHMGQEHQNPEPKYTQDLDSLMSLTGKRSPKITSDLQTDVTKTILILTKRIEKLEKQIQKIENTIPIYIRTQLRKQNQQLKSEFYGNNSRQKSNS